MTKDQVLALAREAGLPVTAHSFVICNLEELERFADLVHNATLEKAAKTADLFSPAASPSMVAIAIRQLKEST